MENKPNKQGKINPGMHAMFMAVIGAYFIYIGYQLVAGMASGSSYMSAFVTILFTVIFAVAGLGVLLYAVHLWRQSKRESAQNADASGDENPSSLPDEQSAPNAEKHGGTHPE